MSRLIPTPRVDKNGATTIRHMKPAAPQNQQRSIPPVAAPAVPELRQPASAESLSRLLYKDHPLNDGKRTDAVWALKELQKLSPQVIDLAEKLLVTGTETAHALIRERMSHTVKLMNALRREHRGDKAGWEWKRRSIASGMDENELRMRWNCGNVMEEGGFAENLVIPGRVERVIEKELEAFYPRTDLTDLSDEKLRGITAFTITDIVPVGKDGMDYKSWQAVEREFNRSAKKFIEYAGKHPDIGLVTRIAMERKTLDVKAIKQVIAEGAKAPSLRDGLL